MKETPFERNCTPYVHPLRFPDAALLRGLPPNIDEQTLIVHIEHSVREMAQERCTPDVRYVIFSAATRSEALVIFEDYRGKPFMQRQSIPLHRDHPGNYFGEIVNFWVALPIPTRTSLDFFGKPSSSGGIRL